MPAPTLTPPPSAPSRLNPTGFPAAGDAMMGWMPTHVDEMTEVVEFVEDAANQLDAAVAVAVGAAGAIAWVSGTTYAIGNVRYSPINFLAYRRKTAGAGTTDPSLDTTNWALAAGQGDATQADIAAAKAFAIAAAAAL